MSQQETATDRLVSIIQTIQMAQGNGTLTVRRGVGGTFEEGIVVFVNGQVKQATAGRRSGPDALNWLSTWGQCRYFFASAGASATSQLQPQNEIPASNQASTPSSSTEPQVRIPTTPLERPGGARVSGTGWERRTPAPPSQTSIISYSTQPLGEALRRIEQNRLSRSHRQLFLLIDGQRTALELARLAAKNQEDLLELLYDLERIGVIQLGGS
ncbi:MAG TPA: hypothetical protein VNE38_13695 [Ktedonobacteraceae bacterium]|nr:hypothetical protein [Ktedonobacteraceae bacterium]